jgi:hypothetical protein
MLMHEVFVHHFRLPRRGNRKWHISYFSMHLHRKTAQAEACAAQIARAGIPTAQLPPEQVFCRKRSSRSSTYSLPPFPQL